MNMHHPSKEIMHPALWLWLPVAFIIFQAGLEIFVPAHLLPGLHSEFGPHEMIQFFIILIAFFVALKILITMKNLQNPFLTAWVGIAAMACFYVAGEELSWGQHVFEWGTPEYWANLNDQGETNFHNTSSWLDQKPRLILEIGVLVGGLIIPFLQWKRPGFLPQKFNIIYPPPYLWVISAIVLGITIIDKIDDTYKDWNILTRASEVEELYLFYFVLLYLLTLSKRFVQNQR